MRLSANVTNSTEQCDTDHLHCHLHKGGFCIQQMLLATMHTVETIRFVSTSKHRKHFPFT